MAEDLSYLRGRLDEACSGIARLEEQVKNLFHRYEERAASDKDRMEKCSTLNMTVTTQGNRIDALEKAKEKGGNRVWELIAIVIAGVVGAMTGKWWK